MEEIEAVIEQLNAWSPALRLTKEGIRRFPRRSRR